MISISSNTEAANNTPSNNDERKRKQICLSPTTCDIPLPDNAPEDEEENCNASSQIQSQKKAKPTEQNEISSASPVTAGSDGVGRAINENNLPVKTTPPASSSSSTTGDSRQIIPNRLHVSNIPFRYRDSDLFTLFSKYGSVKHVEVVYNDRGSKGFGFVTMHSDDEAASAKRLLDGLVVDGRKIEINYALSKRGGSAAAGSTTGLSNGVNKSKRNALAEPGANVAAAINLLNNPLLQLVNAGNLARYQGLQNPGMLGQSGLLAGLAPNAVAGGAAAAAAGNAAALSLLSPLMMKSGAVNALNVQSSVAQAQNNAAAAALLQSNPALFSLQNQLLAAYAGQPNNAILPGQSSYSPPGANTQVTSSANYQNALASYAAQMQNASAAQSIQQILQQRLAALAQPAPARQTPDLAALQNYAAYASAYQQPQNAQLNQNTALPTSSSAAAINMWNAALQLGSSNSTNQQKQ